MGNWQLEVVRMAVYVSFPIIMFTYFNQPQYFEDWVVKTKREIFPSESTEQHKEFERNLAAARRKQELRLLSQLESESSGVTSSTAHPGINQTVSSSNYSEPKTLAILSGLKYHDPSVPVEILLSNTIIPSNYSGLNDSCSHCFMGDRENLKSSVYNMLVNEGFNNYSKSNENCSQCFKGLNNEVHKDTNKTKLVGCMCGLFTTQTPAVGDIPLRTKAFHNVTCHEVVPDEDACKKVCMFAALTHNELQPANICSHLSKATNITAYVESKICQENTVWVFTGLASPSPACCNQGTSINCNEV